MKTIFYKIECLTNLHVGSGDVNYNIIDNEVEKDPVTGYPIIHASGVKGALRDDMKNRGEQFLNKVFGFAGKGDTGNSGSHKIFRCLSYISSYACLWQYKNSFCICCYNSFRESIFRKTLCFRYESLWDR